MQKNLELAVRSREFKCPEIIVENIEEILNKASEENGSFYNPKSKTKKSYVKSVVYGPINKGEIRMLDFKEYLKLGRPSYFYHSALGKNLKLSCIIVSTPCTIEIKYLLKGGYKKLK